MAACVACPLCFHSSFPLVNDLISALLSFLQRPLNCPICNHLAESTQDLRDHLVEHLPSQNRVVTPVEEHNRYVCKQCGVFQTNDILQLRQHVESDHPDRKFLCVHCCKLFKGTLILIYNSNQNLEIKFNGLKFRQVLRYIWEWLIKSEDRLIANTNANFVAKHSLVWDVNKLMKNYINQNHQVQSKALRWTQV